LAGIYIHIPFCRKACHYCNFHFSTSLRLKNGFLAALLKEIDLTPNKGGEPIETIYLGGGTPSLLEKHELDTIITKLRDSFTITPDAEITLEANPDDITAEKGVEWLQLGINRLSIGIQSFREEDLAWMNRAHNALQAKESISVIRAAGFSNFSIDLIFGVPGLSDIDWQKNIATAIDFKVPHISTYALTVEPQTALQKMIALHKKDDVDADMQAAQYEQLMVIMEAGGYEHYEISSFALPGKRSRHNSSYWRGIPYFGFGPSAHSYDGINRKWNVANNVKYIQSLEENIIPEEVEELTPLIRMNEYLMTSLRTAEGIDFNHFSLHWGISETEALKNDLLIFQQKNQVRITDRFAFLTKEGKLFADGIASSLFRT
jgi:oxygen-independent coproporphyrinogen III oxidase